MNRIEFLSSLDRYLGNIDENQKKEILYDYDEHFSVAIEKGKTEEEISAALGSTQVIARQFKAECLLKKAQDNSSAQNIFSAIFAVVGLGFFNIVFVLGPFLGLVGVMVGLFATAFAISISGIAILGAVIFFPWLLSIPQGLYISSEALIFISVALISLGALCSIGMAKLSKLFFNLILKYLKFNIGFVTRRS